VSICNAPHRREELLQICAQKGIAAFVEKPWATNTAHGEALAKICESNPTMVVMPAFSFRFHPVVTQLKSLIETDLGTPWLLSGAYVFGWNPPPNGWQWKPESGNGFFNENSCHLLDIICYLLGKPISVCAEASNPQNMPSENAGAVLIRFENGAIASVILGGVGTGAFQNFPRLHLYTEHGEAQLIGQEHIWHEVEWALRQGGNRERVTRTPESLGETRYSHALRHFLACVQNNTKPTATLADGILCVALAEAIYTSARTGEKVLL
jgi:predicted dehydrogenase